MSVHVCKWRDYVSVRVSVCVSRQGMRQCGAGPGETRMGS